MSEQGEFAAFSALGFQLPGSWTTTTLGILASVSGGLTKNSKRTELPLKIPYLRVANVYSNRLALDEIKEIGVSEGEIDRVLLRADDLLIVEGNGSIDQLGRVAIWNGSISPCAHQNHLIKVRPWHGSASRWLLYWLCSPGGRDGVVKTASSTSGLHTLSLSKVKSLPAVLAPVPEQHRIVAEIEKQFTRLDAAVASLERVKANLVRARASVLKAAVEGRLVPTEAELARAEDRDYEPASVLLERILEERKRKHEETAGKNKYKPPTEPATDGLPELPMGWAWMSPSQAAADSRHSLAIGPFGSNLKVSDYRDKGVPLVFVRNIRSGDFSEESARFVDAEKAADLTAHQCGAGDILITKMGEPPGDSWVYPIGRGRAVVTADVVKWTVSPQLGPRWFFAYATRSSLVKRQILQRTKGVAQKKISLGRFQSVAYPIPPVAEQLRIVAEVERRLSVLDALTETVATNLARCARLRQSILKRAFEGKLVPQDPTDEPASELLARIQAQAPPPKAKKRRRKVASSPV